MPRLFGLPRRALARFRAGGGGAAPEFEKRHGGHHRDRPEDDSGCAEKIDAADERDEGDEGVDLQPSAHQHRAKEIVHAADDQPAPGDENERLQPIAGEGEKQSGGNPEDEGAQNRHDGQEPHHQRPKQRSRQVEPPEDQSAQDALQNGDGQGSIDDRVDRIDDPGGDEIRLGLIERRKALDRRERFPPVAEQIEEQVKGDERAEKLRGRALHEGRAHIGEPRRRAAEFSAEADLSSDPFVEPCGPGVVLDDPPPVAPRDLTLDVIGVGRRLIDQPLRDEKHRRDDDEGDEQHRNAGGDTGVFQPFFDDGVSGREEDRQRRRPGEGRQERRSEEGADAESGESDEQAGQGVNAPFRPIIVPRGRRLPLLPRHICRNPPVAALRSIVEAIAAPPVLLRQNRPASRWPVSEPLRSRSLEGDKLTNRKRERQPPALARRGKRGWLGSRAI